MRVLHSSPLKTISSSKF